MPFGIKWNKTNLLKWQLKFAFVSIVHVLFSGCMSRSAD